MRSKAILVDASLTGGRGPAKQAYEFITACQERQIQCKLITNRSFVPKLKNLGLQPDFVLDAELSYPNERIYKTYYKALENINFDLLVKFGARTASTYNAYKLRKPFIVVDGGLPEVLESYPSLYAKEGYVNAQKYILTTHFPWEYPAVKSMKNIVVGTYPFSQKTLDLTKGLRSYNKNEILEKVKRFIPELENVKHDLLINLVMTSDYVADPMQRKTYGAWLTTTQLDECVGFLRRFITDLGIQYSSKALVFMDAKIFPLVEDLFAQYPNIKGCFNKKEWSYEVEILMYRLADVLVSRATNYVPNIAMMGQGALVTTPVPAHGYMNEDIAGDQAKKLDLTELISYNDEDYMKKFLSFVENKHKQTEISKNLIKVSENMLNNGLNSVDLILEEFNYV